MVLRFGGGAILLARSFSRRDCPVEVAGQLFLRTYLYFQILSRGAILIDLIIVRFIFVAILTVSAFALQPFNLPSWANAVVGLVLGACIIFFEIRLETITLKRLIGAAVGSVLGILGAYLMS